MHLFELSKRAAVSLFKFSQHMLGGREVASERAGDDGEIVELDL